MVFEGKHHAEFDRVSPPGIQPERAWLSRRLSRRRGEPLPGMRAHALDHRAGFRGMRLLLDGNASKRCADERTGCGAGVLERKPAELRRPRGVSVTRNLISPSCA